MWLFDLFFFLYSEIWYVEVLVSRSISESLFDFEVMRVDCTFFIVFDRSQNMYTFTMFKLSANVPYSQMR